MKNSWLPKLKSVTFALLFLLAAALPAAGGQGAGGRRHHNSHLAPDLEESARTGSPDQLVRVVASTKGKVGPWTATQIASLGGAIQGIYPEVQELVVDLPLGAVEPLTGVDGVDYVAPDREVVGLESHLRVTTGASQAFMGSRWASYRQDGQKTSALYDGSGVAVAIIDSGIDVDHADLRDGEGRRTVLSVDFTDEGTTGDPYGHGTHVAGIVGGDGSSYSHDGWDYSGIAPGATILNLRVLDRYGRGTVSRVIAAIDFAVANRAAFNVRVINLSLAAAAVESFRDDPLCRAIERANDAGIVVVAAAGNFGRDLDGNEVYGGITSPGNAPAAITVGASSTRGTDRRSDDTVANFSSRGPTRSRSVDPVTGEVAYDNLAKPDLVAPGVRVVSLESRDNLIVRSFPELHVASGNGRYGYMVLSGTSMSTAAVSGAALLILQANPNLTPNMVKAVLMYSAQMLDGADLFQQGAGLLNIEGSVRLARLSRKGPLALAPAGEPGSGLTAPRAQTTIAGQTFAWAQGLIWGRGWVTGNAVLDLRQAAYAQSLIWGLRRDVWGEGVVFSDGLFSDSYVVTAEGGEWSGIVWDRGASLDSGAVWREEMTATGTPWASALIPESFFAMDSSGLIWGYGRAIYDAGLIWGLNRFDW